MLSANGQEHLERTWFTEERTDYSIRQDIVNFKRGEGEGVNSKHRVRSSLGIGYGGLKWLVIAGLWTWISPAKAEEPRTAKEPRLMAESTEITQVADAFDDDDPIDVNLSLGYQYSSRSADILREAATSTGFYTRGTDKIAQYKESTNRLLMRGEIGLFHDLSFIVRMPVILSNSQSLGDYSGSSTQQNSLRGAQGEQLFSVPFSSPSRHGIEYLALGLDLGLMNQYRDHTKPTWIVGVESRFSVGTPMHACNNNPKDGEVNCASPGDVDRNGRQDDQALKALPTTSPTTYPLEGGGPKREPGVSRGTTGLELHSYISKRIKYIEPYGGFRLLFEFPNAGSDYGVTDLRGNLVNHPPLQGTVITGLSVIPYEVRSDYQRLTIDLRLEATYRSEGRDYNELFDALGSSDAQSLRMPNYTKYLPPPTVQTPGSTTTSLIDPTSQRVYVSGLMDTQQYVITRYSVGVTFQANRYIKFTVGSALNHIQGHYLTFDQPCNASLNSSLQDAGPCRGRSSVTADYTAPGIPNPNYRPVINAPGRRFLVDGSSGFDGWLMATAMF